jgi:plasmid stabilization system protein ParE
MGILTLTNNSKTDLKSVATYTQRKFPHITHVIFYRRLDNSQIEDIRILHKRIDVVMKLRSP